MLEPSSVGLLDQGRERARLLQAEPVAEMLERLGHGAAGADFEIGHVDVGAQRRIGVAELAPDPLQRRLHAQAGIGADHQQVHEIRKAGAVLVAARRRCAGRYRCSGRHSRRCRRPSPISQSIEPVSGTSIGMTKNAPIAERRPPARCGRRRSTPTARGSKMPAWIIRRRSTLASPLSVGGGIVLGGVVEQPLHRAAARAAQRARVVADRPSIRRCRRRGA